MADDWMPEDGEKCYLDWKQLYPATELILREGAFPRKKKEQAEAIAHCATELAQVKDRDANISSRSVEAMLSANAASRTRFLAGQIRLVGRYVKATLGDRVRRDFEEAILRQHALLKPTEPISFTVITGRRHVLVTQSIHDIVRQDRADSCEIPPGHELRLRRTITKYWTNDPFDKIESEIEDTPYIYPWDLPKRKLLDEGERQKWRSNVDKDLEYALRHILKSYPCESLCLLSETPLPVNSLILEAQKAAQAEGVPLPGSFFQLLPYAEEIKVRLKNHLRPFQVWVADEPEQFKQAAADYWKRARARHYIGKFRDNRRKLMFRMGPFYSAAGNEDALPISQHYPLRTAHPGCLLVAWGEYDGAKNWIHKEGNLQPFYDPDDPTHRLHNTGTTPIFAWFRINDDRPGDNDIDDDIPGYCDLVYEIVRIT
jgi:hypothetical protein